MFKFIASLCAISILGAIAGQSDQQYRLPDDVQPLSYDLKIIPNLDTLDFSGIIAITFVTKRAIQAIQMHSKNLIMKDSKVLDMNQQQAELGEIKLNPDYELLTINLYKQIAADQECTVKIEFSGKINNIGIALFIGSYTSNKQTKCSTCESTSRRFATTRSHGIHAREIFPCFDEPRFRTPFTISISRTKTQNSISNTQLDGTYKSSNENRMWDKYKKSPPMATHQIAFLVYESDSTYTSVTLHQPKTVINLWMRENLKKYSEYALKQSNAILQNLQNYFSVDYELLKLDIAIIPHSTFDLSANWGMIQLEEKFAIADEQNFSENQKTQLIFTLANTIARQWFGGMVTPISWDYFWLTEALAAYAEMLITNQLQPSWKIDQFFVVRGLQYMLRTDNSDQPLTTAVNTASKINVEFGEINTHKGASIIRMLEHIISANSLRNVFHKYLKYSQNPQSRLVTPVNFYKILEEETKTLYLTSRKITITEIMKTWTENPGYPLLTLKRNYLTNEATIEQIPYQPSDISSNPSWIVPITYTTKSKAQFTDTTPTLWSLGDEITRISNVDSTDWLICNLQQTGYYRVNYDLDNWNLIIEQLTQNPDAIHVSNRAQLIDDSFTLASDGKIPYDVPLRLGKYLTDETETTPLLSAIHHLEKLHTKYENTASRRLVCIYAIRIFEKQYQRVGFYPKPTDDYSTKLGRLAILSLVCKLGRKTCIQNALENYEKNILNLNNTPSDLKPLVFCTALKHASDTEEVYRYLWRAYRESEIAYDRQTILEAFGCIRHENILTELLSKAVDPADEQISGSDKVLVMKSISSSPLGITAGLQLLQHALISENDGKISNLKILLNEIENSVQTETHLRLLQKLENRYSQLDHKKYREFAESFRKIRSLCIQRIRENNKKSEIIKPIMYQVLNIVAPTPPPLVSASSVTTNSVTVPILFLCSSLVIYLISV